MRTLTCWSVVAVAGCFAFAAAACENPALVSIPEGKASTLEQMLAAQAQVKTYQAKSTVWNKEMSAAAEERRLPSHVGKYSREVDVALPGKHTTKLYNQLKRDEASILAQLRTGATRLNSYLHKIGRAESDLCPCGSTSETIKHFLFRCSLWNQQRLRLFKDTSPRNGNLSYCVRGKTPADSPEWAPDMKAVRATSISPGRQADSSNNS